MPKAIFSDSRNNRTTGFARPGIYRDKRGTVEQLVHDGDTINVELDGNLGVRFLGIDTPEVSFMFPGKSFLDLDDAQWNEFLASAFDKRWGTYQRKLSREFRSWMDSKLQADGGSVHAKHANDATVELKRLIAEDMRIMKQTPDTYRYYMGFGFEVTDAYGRLLCTINRNQPERDLPSPRPMTYNLRLLESGHAFPYFIWPNISPWERPDSTLDAVIPPGEARQRAEDSDELTLARKLVSTARQEHKGLFDASSPCLLEPFELRFLCRRSIPSRYVIDLNSDGNELIRPEEYFRIPFSEDRLWIPPTYVPLFEKRGWKIS